MNFGDQIWCVLSVEISFETFTLVWFHVNEKENNLPKIQNLKFLQNSLNKFGIPKEDQFLWEFDLDFWE